MIISNSRRFIFVHNYKTGGESIAAALEPHLDRADLALNRAFELLGSEGAKGLLSDVRTLASRRQIRKEHPELRALSKHSSARSIRDCLPAGVWADYYTFAFVRHPIDRTISLYQYCARMTETRRAKKFPLTAWYLTPWGKPTDPLHWPAVRAYVATASFSEFIRHPALADEEGMRPQFDSISGPDGEIIVDLVARFEYFDEEFARIQAQIGIPPVTAGRRNASGRSSVARAELSSEDRAYLAQHFAIDFARLGYEL